MAKKSVCNRQLKREKCCEKYREKRLELKKIIKDPNTSSEERWSAMLSLQRLPRDSSPVRLRNRCRLTGRARGVYRDFGVCRIVLRELVMNGMVPGSRKASW